MTDTLDRKRSVTRDDYVAGSPDAGGVWIWQVMDPGAMTAPSPELPPLAAVNWGVDALLSATVCLEDMWASAVNQAATKLAVRGFEISDTDDSTSRIKKQQNLVMNFDGLAAYRSGVSKLAQDFVLTRNGCFFEIERESRRPNSRPRAIWHLDSHRCRRTGHRDYPVVYWDMLNRPHALRSDQVIFWADMPSPRAQHYGVGRPAAERAWKTIVKLAAVETYFREKITGARALKLVFISSIARKQLAQVAETSDAEMERRGHVAYKGAVLVPTGDDKAVSIAEVDLASVPDGFNVQDERRDAYLRYANAIGIPVQDLQPLSGQGLGTGTQTIILDEAAEGRGLAYFVSTFEDKINWLLMPRTTTFQVKSNDLRDQKARAELQSTQAATIMQLKGTEQAPGILTKDQALNMAVDEGLVPREFLPEDVTPESTVTDSGDQSKPAGPGDELAADALAERLQRALADRSAA